MVELFKTNVSNEAAAGDVLRELASVFKGHRFNFDLQDRDRLLRVECTSGELAVDEILTLLISRQIKAEILEDTIFPPTGSLVAVIQAVD